MNISTDCVIQKLTDATTAGTSTITSGIVDMAGFQSVLFLTTIGTPNAGNILKVQEGNAANMSDAADLKASHVTPTGGSAGTAYFDVHRPLKRYLQIVATRGASTTIGEIYAVKYNGTFAPRTNVAGQQFGVLLPSPAEGTA